MSRAIKLSVFVLLTALATAPVQAYAQTVTAQPLVQGISAAPLAPMAAVADGLATPTDSGLQPDLWGGMTFTVWQALLNGLPAGQNSPTLRGLVADVLEARAALPISAAGQQQMQDITLLRAHALVPFASADRFNLFVAAQSTGNRSPALALLTRDMTFASDPARACALTVALPAVEAAAPWGIYCALLAGHADEAQIQTDALRDSTTSAENEDATDALRAIDAATTETFKNLPQHMTLFSARTLGLSTKTPASAFEVQANGLLAQRAASMVLAARADPAAAAAAEYLADRGYIDALTFAGSYAGIAFKAKSDTATSALKGAPRRAMLYQLLVAAPDTNNRARLLSDLITSGGAAATLGPRGAILAPALLQIPANAAYGWAAPTMFALAAGQEELEAAEAWYRNVESLANSLPEAAAWHAKLWPIALAMGVDGADPSGLDDWVAAAVDLPEKDKLPVAGILTLLEARGVVVPPTTWAAAGDDNAIGGGTAATDPAQRALLHAAGKRQGELILRSAILAGTDLSQAPTPTIAALIRALTQADLNQAADRLTVEALLALIFPSLSN